jgi:hypothetical protein
MGRLLFCLSIYLIRALNTFSLPLHGRSEGVRMRDPVKRDAVRRPGCLKAEDPVKWLAKMSMNYGSPSNSNIV